ncbi:hypothetical protein B566_EDAN017241 [Ephemera danica]|nr:hypothetical protein B566_EDAN017241 [Ephemera danica]
MEFIQIKTELNADGLFVSNEMEVANLPLEQEFFTSESNANPPVKQETLTLENNIDEASIEQEFFTSENIVVESLQELLIPVNNVEDHLIKQEIITTEMDGVEHPITLGPRKDSLPGQSNW